MIGVDVALALLSAVAWAFWSICGKLSTNHGVPSVMLAFAASCTSFSVVTLVYVWQRSHGPNAVGDPLGVAQWRLWRHWRSPVFHGDQAG
jgi:drug/metabolite transporter (DMT)-like permease